MRIGPPTLVLLFIALLGHYVSGQEVTGPTTVNDGDETHAAANPGISLDGPLNHFAKRTTPKSHTLAGQQAIRPLPISYSSESARFQPLAATDAPRPEFEPLSDNLQPTQPQMNSGMGLSSGTVERLGTNDHLQNDCGCPTPAQVQCRDEWAGVCNQRKMDWECNPRRLNWECNPRRLKWECNPRPLDWECDCEQFPRAERQPPCSTCPVGRARASRPMILERIAARLQSCGCNQGANCECPDSPTGESSTQPNQSTCNQCGRSYQDCGCRRLGPGNVGRGVLKPAREHINATDSINEPGADAYYQPTSVPAEFDESNRMSIFGPLNPRTSNDEDSPFNGLQPKNVCRNCLTEKSTPGDFCQDCKSVRAKASVNRLQR